jgi:hypothetical protein
MEFLKSLLYPTLIVGLLSPVLYVGSIFWVATTPYWINFTIFLILLILVIRKIPEAPKQQ